LNYKRLKANFLAYRLFKYSFVASLKNYYFARRIFQSMVGEGRGLHFTQINVQFFSEKSESIAISPAEY
jgi:hypothetical protein